jgi:hypothetical protein
MTGLVPVIHVGVAPEGLGWAGNWNRVDGRDKPGHDGERRLAERVPLRKRTELER